jgi:salicylate hydroxylase
MFGGAVEYPEDHASSYDREEYVMWGFPARRGILRLEGAPDEISVEDAKTGVLAQIVDWSPALRHLVERTERSSSTTFAVKSSVPIEPWPTKRVTLMGAIQRR